MTMCCCGDEQDGGAARADERITAYLRSAKDRDTHVHKLLLLGAGESGKSTIFKQMRILHGSGYTEEDLRLFKPILQMTIISAVRQLIRALNMTADRDAIGAAVRDAIGHDIVVPDRVRRAIDEIGTWGFSEPMLTPERGVAIKRLWACPILKQVYKHRNLFHLPDNSNYFLDKIDEISQSDWVPSTRDIIMSRVRSVGVVEHEFVMPDKTAFKLVDVGGQRSERRKWINVFTDIEAVLYIVAISEYDQKCYEDNTNPRIDESIAVLQDILRISALASAYIIIFLNKTDVFVDKLKSVPLNRYMPNYHGDNTFNDAAIFIRNLFDAAAQEVFEEQHVERPIYFHFTTATDPENVEKVFHDVRTIVLRKALQKQNLL